MSRNRKNPPPRIRHEEPSEADKAANVLRHIDPTDTDNPTKEASPFAYIFRLLVFLFNSVMTILDELAIVEPDQYYSLEGKTKRRRYKKEKEIYKLINGILQDHRQQQAQMIAAQQQQQTQLMKMFMLFIQQTHGTNPPTATPAPTAPPQEKPAQPVDFSHFKKKEEEKSQITQQSGLFYLVSIAVDAFNQDRDHRAMAQAIVTNLPGLVEGCNTIHMSTILDSIERHKAELDFAELDEEEFISYLVKLIEEIRSYSSKIKPVPPDAEDPPEVEPTDPERPPTIPIEPDKETP